MDKNLKYFMRAEAKEEQVVEVPGPASITDENGKVVPIKIKKLHNETISNINKMYVERTPLRDKKGNFVVQGGEVVFKTERNRDKAAQHLFVEALVEPNLRDPELMKFFNCVDITEMPQKVFPTNEEYSYVNKKILEILGLAESEESDKKDVDDAKN